MRISKADPFASAAASKYRREIKRGLALGDVARSSTAVYLIVPDEALSAALAYSIYFEAKKRGAGVDAMYATSVNLDSLLPDYVKAAGERRRLPKSRVEELRGKFITPNILEVLLR